MNDCPMTSQDLMIVALLVEREGDEALANRMRRLADWLANDRRRRRDLFAAAAMQGYLASNSELGLTRAIEYSWSAAHRMLAAEPPMPEVER